MPDYYNYDQNSGQQPMYNPPQYQPQAGMDPPPGYVQKSRVAAGILAILLGTYGIHSFYLGNPGPFAAAADLVHLRHRRHYHVHLGHCRRRKTVGRPHQHRRKRRILEGLTFWKRRLL